jgi:uncharacterized cupin superfamily protein
MGNLTFLKFDEPGARRERVPLAERLLADATRFAEWDAEEPPDGKVRTGAWQAKPGTTRFIKGGVREFCYIVSGLCELVEDGKDPIRLQAGDAFVMKPGYVGKWRCLETTRTILIVYGVD